MKTTAAKKHQKHLPALAIVILLAVCSDRPVFALARLIFNLWNQQRPSYCLRFLKPVNRAPAALKTALVTVL
jgi:hypothetical protein